MELLDRILDKGIVLDNAGRLQLLNGELKESDDHVVVRSSQVNACDKAA